MHGKIVLLDDDAAALDGEAAGGKEAKGLGIGEMLLDLNAGVEGFGGVVLEDGNGALDDDGAAVGAGVDEVDGAAGDLAAVVEGLLPGVEAGEGGEKGGVDVENAAGEGGEEGGLDDAHEAGEDDGVGTGLADGLDVGILGGALELGLVGGGGEEAGGDVVAAGALEDGCALDVGEDEDDLGVKVAGGDGVEDGLHVGAGTGAEHGEAKFRHGVLPRV